MSGEYFSHMLDLLISLKNGCISGIRVRVGRLHVSFSKKISLILNFGNLKIFLALL